MEPDFQTLFQAVPALYLVLAPDPARTIVAASDAYLRATMTQRHEILGRGVFDVFPDNPDDPTATGTRNLAASLARVIATGAADTMEVQQHDVRRPGGDFEERWWSPVNTPVVGAGGEVRYLIHRVEDVTELARARRDSVALAARVVSEQQRAELRFRDLVDLAPDAVVACDAAGTILLVNIAAERMFGYARTEMLGQPVEMLVPERARAAHPGHVASFVASPAPRPLSSDGLAGRRKDGSEFPVEICLSPVRAAGGMVVSTSIRDLTERKRIEAAARRADAYLASAVEAIEDAFVIYDEHDRIVLVNRAFRRIFGEALPEPLIGLCFDDLVEAGMDAHIYDLGALSDTELRARRRAHHRAPSGTFEMRTAGGRILRVLEQRTPEGGTVSLYVDITGDVARQDELRAARQEAEAASVAKSEFLASVSHELRTPLNAILGFAELLHRDRKEPLSPRHLERLEHVQRGGAHLMLLVDDLLDLGRIDAGRLEISVEPVEVEGVVRQVVAMLEPMAADRGITVRHEAEGPAPTAVVDRTRLSQILMNFGSNAIKYGREGGRATLRISRAEAGVVRIAMSDDGLGIPADKQSKIFAPFQRAGRETGPIQGTGIGLAITRRLAAMMGGSVGFSSEVGRGSEFWVDLPEYRAQPDVSARTS